ncbi:MAG: ABC transporter ATP-binding protein [Paracoccaceae bacterium]
MAEVILKEVKKNFGKSTVINDVSIKIKEGDFCVIVGPSGCGKSTLLRIIAGLETPTSGSIIINSKDVTAIDPANRGIGMVFQNYALYPHMTVEDNMSFGLRMNNAPKNTIKKKVGEAAKILQLTELMTRKPASLSGGQRQRVAIGRAIVKGSNVFLFDEPLSNLDAELRVEMRIELTRLHKELGATIIYVTHDQTEAMTMADKIVVLRNGCVEQIGDPLELYSNPDNKFVAGFLGSPSMNFLEAKFDGKDLKVQSLENVKIKKFPSLSKKNSKITIGVRPQDVLLKRSTKGKKIEFVENLGNLSIYHTRLDKNHYLLSESNNKESLLPGEHIQVTFNEKSLYFFDQNSGLRII